jgi:hypothetical protein
MQRQKIINDIHFIVDLYYMYYYVWPNVYWTNILWLPELPIYDNFNSMTRSGMHKSKEIRNLIFVEYYYFCCAIYFNA